MSDRPLDSSENNYQVSDKFYKTIFSYKELVEEFFNLFFPQFARLIDFKKARHLKTSFIKSDYTDREADVLYSVPIAGKEVYIYILIEHQSQPDKKIFLRLLEYQLSLWMDLVKKEKVNPMKLPPILPIIAYNGRKKWKIPKQFKKSFDKVPKELLRFVPYFEYLLFDLSQVPQDFLSQGSELIKKPLLLDKKRESIDSAIQDYLGLSNRTGVNKEIVSDLLKIGYYFILYYTQKAPEQLEFDLEECIKDQKIKEELKQMSKTAAMQLIERGIKQGLEQGKQEGKVEGKAEGLKQGQIEMAKKLLIENADVAFVMRITGLSQEEVLRLKES